MGGTHISYTIPQDNYEDSKSPVELQNLRNVPSEPLPRRPITRAKRTWQYLHPVAWLLLLCIGGPILLHALYDKYFNLERGPTQSSNLTASPLPCDVEDAWSSWSSLFEINIRTRNLSFTAAKLIDVAFDVIVGRGGQAVLAWMAYRVYTDVLIRVAEKSQVRYDLFAAVTIKPNDFLTFAKTAASIPGTPHLWAKSTLLWMVLAMAYLLAYPTLVSTATSLVAGAVTSVRLDGGGTAPLVPYVTSAAYSIANSGIDGRPDPWILSVDYVTQLPNGACDMGIFSNHAFGGHGEDDHTLVVNGTAYKLSDKAVITCGFHWQDAFYPFNVSAVHTDVMEELFPGKLVCLPDGNNYQWGASWELLVLILIVHIAWSASLLLVWIEATAHSPLVCQGRKMSMWRAILDLSRPLLMRLGSNGGMLDSDQLEEYIRHMSSVHYETKFDGAQDGDFVQDVHLVPSSDATLGETEVGGGLASPQPPQPQSRLAPAPANSTQKSFWMHRNLTSPHHHPRQPQSPTHHPPPPQLTTTATMHLMYTLDAEGTRIYTLKKINGGEVTKSAHPARFSPDDKYSRHRVTLKKRYGLLLTQQKDLKVLGQ
ncbi:hypothetical protein O988_01351 [Pseudogymnoascus sp. VKM F-3808]|nr:hypothetical protein O988_01351 [Pseudogymnoascus sp. VKM F-3808]